MRSLQFTLAKATVTATLLLSLAAHAQYLNPASNLVIENIPPIAADLPSKLAAYTEFKPSSIVAWHPRDGSMLIRTRLGDTLQLHLVKSPSARPEPLTEFADTVNGATFQPLKGDYLLFQKANGGDEVFRIYRMDLPGKLVTPISAEGERAGTPAWNRSGNRIVYTTVTTDRSNRGTGASRVATQNESPGTTDADSGARSVVATADIRRRRRRAWRRGDGTARRGHPCPRASACRCRRGGSWSRSRRGSQAGSSVW